MTLPQSSTVSNTCFTPSGSRIASEGTGRVFDRIVRGEVADAADGRRDRVEDVRDRIFLSHLIKDDKHLGREPHLLLAGRTAAGASPTLTADHGTVAAASVMRKGFRQRTILFARSVRSSVRNAIELLAPASQLPCRNNDIELAVIRRINDARVEVDAVIAALPTQPTRAPTHLVECRCVGLIVLLITLRERQAASITP